MEEQPVDGHDIITIGASAGGVETLRALVRDLPVDLPAALFIVLHIPPETPSNMPAILSRSGSLPAIHPRDGAPVEYGKIYLAPPDRHLLLDGDNTIHIVRGPRENRHRPAIDPLFRSAARAAGNRVVGIVLTGALDDGTAGLLAIKRRGGIAIAQDPDEALYSDMPRSAIENVAVDYVLPTHQITQAIISLAHTPPKEGGMPVPEDMEIETRIANMDPVMIDLDKRPGNPSVFSCPECKGVLYEIQEGELVRYRCRTGHAFSPDSMMVNKENELENALYAALNALEESLSLSRRMAAHARMRNNLRLAERFEQRSRDTEQRAGTVQKILLRTDPLPDRESTASGPAITGT